MLPGLSGARFGQALATARTFVSGAMSGRLSGKGMRDANNEAEKCRRLQEYAETRRRADEALRRADAVMQSAGDRDEEAN